MQTKIRKRLIALVALAAAGVLGLTALPVAAESAPVSTSDQVIEGTFSVEADDDTAILKLGHNLFVAGNTIQGTSVTDSLMFVAGNSLNLGTVSEYGFVAGNTIQFSGKTTKDLFIAGNTIELSRNAEIGRDVFAAGNSVTVVVDLPGDLSVTAATVVLDDVEIAGNLNLSAGTIIFKDNVKVAGAVVYNEDAEVKGLDYLKYGSIEVYEVKEYETPLIAIWYAKLLSVVALFVVMLIIIAVWKRVPVQVAKAKDVSIVARNVVVGLAVLILVPILSFLTLMTYVLAPVGLLLIAIYIIMMYLSQGFAGLWLGRVLLQKVVKIQSNAFIETATGILVLGLLSLVPYLGVLTGFIGLLLGLGLIITCLKPGSSDVEEAKVVSSKSSQHMKNAKKSGQKAKK